MIFSPHYGRFENFLHLLCMKGGGTQLLVSSVAVESDTPNSTREGPPWATPPGTPAQRQGTQPAPYLAPAWYTRVRGASRALQSQETRYVWQRF